MDEPRAQTTRELLIQIATRQEQMREDLARLMAAVANGASRVDLERVQKETKESLQKVDDTVNGLIKKFVTKEEFDPVRRIVYGVVGIILIAVLTALMGVVIGGIVP